MQWLSNVRSLTLLFKEHGSINVWSCLWKSIMSRTKEITEDLGKRVDLAHQSRKGYKTNSKEFELHKCPVRQIVYKWRIFKTSVTFPRSGRHFAFYKSPRTTVSANIFFFQVLLFVFRSLKKEESRCVFLLGMHRVAGMEVQRRKGSNAFPTAVLTVREWHHSISLMCPFKEAAGSWGGWSTYCKSLAAARTHNVIYPWARKLALPKAGLCSFRICIHSFFSLCSVS